MKFKRIIISIILILTIFSLFLSDIYANYSGYFLKGFADGLKSGLQMGIQIKETKWKTKQLEEIEKELDRILEQWKYFTDNIQKLIESGQIHPELGKKFLVLNFLLPIELQEHGQSVFNGIMFVDKNKVAVEKQYFKNVFDTISLTSAQFTLEILNSLTNLLSNDKKVVINTIMESGFSYQTSQSELKYNPFKNKWEYAPSGSSLRYNSFENKWEFAMPDENVQYNPYENKWEFASPIDKIKYNPFENKWSYENPDNSLKYNPFQNKWEYAPSNSILKYNPFSNSWSYE